MTNSLFSTLIKLKGNTRACIYTEPLWGLSMNLCIPYLSVYMLALGLNDTRVGFIVTINTLSQIVFSFLSGPITDKIGRRKTTAVFDVLAWCIPALIWWRAENFWFFLTAGIINGTNGVTANSWNCLAVEDAEKKQITRIYSLAMACGQLSAVFAPITSILISRLTLVPAIRILYINGFILMSIKVIVLYLASKETGIGVLRIHETKGKNIFQLAGGYGGVIKIILYSRGMVFSMIIAALAGTVGMINNTFWQIIANKKLLVPEAILPLFMVFRSILAIFFLFFVIPRLSRGLLKIPLLLGFAIYFLGQSLLIMVPVEGFLKYPLLCLSLVFDGFGLGTISMLSESLIALHVNPAERARIMAIRFMLVMGATAPFGWIGGILSDISRNLPFALNLGLLLLGIIITLFHYHHKDADHSAEQ
jgi:MFS family permease